MAKVGEKMQCQMCGKEIVRNTAQANGGAIPAHIRTPEAPRKIGGGDAKT